MSERLTAAPKIPAKWRKLAEARCAESGSRLTPARLSAYAEFLESGRPISAYELIARLEEKEQRKIAPPTVYRLLDFLIGVGLVHRLESTQSYVACGHPDHTHASQYLLCSACGSADELESSELEQLLAETAGEHGFQPDKTVVEVTGICGDCAHSDSR